MPCASCTSTCFLPCTGAAIPGGTRGTCPPTFNSGGDAVYSCPPQIFKEILGLLFLLNTSANLTNETRQLTRQHVATNNLQELLSFVCYHAVCFFVPILRPYVQWEQVRLNISA